MRGDRPATLSETPKPSPGWAIEITGERIDLDDLRELLRPPFDPWVEEFVEEREIKLMLRSKAWEFVESGSMIATQAAKMLERLHGGALLVHEDAKPVVPGRVLRFREDGTRVAVMVAATGHISLRGGRVRGRSVVNSEQLSQPPQPSSLQRWVKSADNDDDRADLLEHLSRADNWFDVYKAAEIIRRLAGGQKSLESLLGELKPDWVRVWQTANCTRHAPDPEKYPLPEVPATLHEARLLICRAAKLVV
jgi:hypothetical protein